MITHDNGIIKPSKGKYTDIFGGISIGNNCFVGARTIILPGISICDNVIIAAGSVVTKTIYDDKSIWGGNPARRIGNWDDYLSKNEIYALNTNGKSYEDKKKYLMENQDKMKVR